MYRIIEAEYDKLQGILSVASVHQVEDIMRHIHIINLKIKAYGFVPQKEPEEYFED